MKLIPDYENAVSAIIDWFEDNNNKYGINLEKIGTYGMSLGGYLSPRSAAFEKRVTCAVGNGGFGYLKIKMKKINPIYIRGFLYMTGYKNIDEAKDKWSEIDIREAPPLDCPLLFIQGGKDKVIPNPKEQADYILDWAVGKKKLMYYPEGEHCCGNFLDEVIPYTMDWLREHL